MPNRRRASCQCCGRHRSEVGPISHGGLCGECGIAILTENVLGISRRQGWPHLRRLKGMTDYIERQYTEAARDAG